ncbi:putative transmembrane protein [Cyclobacterium qasimii M12-11B]|uniref:Putative transmembrane protein n=1 Tax=Cyclobacterium qasimii M12-11B TaxID=641524 RepID=S7WFD1_9BACT|nr:putative transmembrane protein [Cyclobacterium qasimii M12-11B]
MFIGSSFVGMVSSDFMSGYIRLALAGCLFSIVYINNSGFYEGYGGALGALALIALLSTMGISVVFSKRNKLTNSFLWLRNKVFNPKK